MWQSRGHLNLIVSASYRTCRDMVEVMHGSEHPTDVKLN